MEHQPIDKRELKLYYYATEYQCSRIQRIHDKFNLNAQPVPTSMILRSQDSTGVKYYSKVQGAAETRVESARYIVYYIDFVQGDVDLEAIIKDKGAFECVLMTGFRAKKHIECTLVAQDASCPYGGAIKPNGPTKLEKLKRITKRVAAKVGKGVGQLNCFSRATPKASMTAEKKVYYDSDSEYAESVFNEKKGI